MNVTIVTKDLDKATRLLPALRELGIANVKLKQAKPRHISIPMLNLQEELAKLEERQVQVAS